ncbi:hypothetical protein [Modestobacter sp. Leaf380]|uniref:hypothetical protein n=1 Tax=Modestobacter sp. Leaf380 TaxID=1736356 RepID=UPI0012F9EB6B|nr:hypothetical protein [Modestobacter sp. Leaf380]
MRSLSTEVRRLSNSSSSVVIFCCAWSMAVATRSRTAALSVATTDQRSRLDIAPATWTKNASEASDSQVSRTGIAWERSVDCTLSSRVAALAHICDAARAAPSSSWLSATACSSICWFSTAGMPSGTGVGSTT